jgi:transcriptional regulator with XRE-family HTH domain
LSPIETSIRYVNDISFRRKFKAYGPVYRFVYILPGMDLSDLIRSARRNAGLTQSDLARQAHTTQPAIAAYESGRRTPSVATLRRVLGACEHDLLIAAHPRIRRGAQSLRELAPAIAADLRDRRESDALRRLYGFADDFRGSSRPGKVELLRKEPPFTGDERFDAALAGAAEHFAREAALSPPSWVDADIRFVEPWWFVSSAPALDGYVLAHTPAAFARHGVFIAREVFDRV